MGYCMDQREAKFKILAANKAAALAWIKRLLEATGKMSGGAWTGSKRMSSSFSWVTMHEFENATTLEDALSAWRWGTDLNEAGDIVDICFQGQKLGDDVVLFEQLAKFVEDGSYIEMQGEDGSLWRWCFDNKKLSEKGAKISWE